MPDRLIDIRKRNSRMINQNLSITNVSPESLTPQTKPNPFILLNYHVRIIILKFLRFSDIKRLLTTNKQFFNDITHFLSSNLEKLSNHDCLGFETIHYSHFFSRLGCKIIHLEIYCVGIDLLSVFTSLPPHQIQYLKLKQCPSAYLQSLRFLSIFQKTFSKSMHTFKIITHHIPAESIPYFSSLYQTARFSDLSQFWKQLQSLLKLSIKTTNSHFEAILDATIYDMFLSSVINNPSLKLTSLKVQNCKISLFFNPQHNFSQSYRINNPVNPQEPIDDPFDQRFKHLQTFSILACESPESQILGINNQTLEIMSKMLPTSLKKLSIQDNQVFNHKNFSENPLSDFTQACPNIESLSLDGYRYFTNISSFSIMQLSEKYNKLSRIGLASCIMVERGIHNLFLSKNFENLIDLNLDYTSIEGALRLMVEENVQLRKISIENCQRISKEELILFFSHSKSLTRVSVRKLKCFTKKSLIPLVQNNSNHLVLLSLEGNKIDNLHIAYLMRYCKRLESLSLRKLDKMHPNFNSNIFHLARSYAECENYSPVHSRLKNLDISYNSTFNDDIISQIHYIFPYLEIIHFNGCPITSIRPFLLWKNTLSILNISNTSLQVDSQESLEQFIEDLSRFPSLYTVFIEIQDLQNLLRNYDRIWEKQPIFIKETINTITKLLCQQQPL